MGRPAKGFRSDTEEILRNLDDWENEWFPIIDAVLRRHHPAVHAQVFDKLSQTSGDMVAMSVRKMLDRLAQMRAGQGSYGEEGVVAFQRLVARGLTEDVLTVPAELLERLAKADRKGDRRALGLVPRVEPDRARRDS